LLPRDAQGDLFGPAEPAQYCFQFEQEWERLKAA